MLGTIERILLTLLPRSPEADESNWSPSGWSSAATGDAKDPRFVAREAPKPATVEVAVEAPAPRKAA